VALTDGDIVAVYTGFNSRFTPQPAMFGVYKLHLASRDVLWMSGLQTTGISAGTSLDKIADPAAAGQATIGKVVQIAPPTVSGVDVQEPSAALQGIAVSAYSRQRNGAGAEVEFVLVALFGGGWYEALTSVITVLDDR